ncbi:uncharacterized protein LOC131629311 [Vicia villosa]|uniref:uncharacterized protein LOC131629311 n=1 Tax=Vicia villosa TaxID=3911 RepID=UPI00273B0B9B|nr:uncharacterized protein LOC131629311 [Vicia villosa]
MEDVTEKINDFDKEIVANIGGNNEAVVKDRREATKELWNCLNVKESMLRLKSCNIWLKEGDKNSRFFHNSIKVRQRGNAITSLEGSNGRVEGVENIKEEVKRYFLNFFKEEDQSRPVPEGLVSNSLKEGDVVWLRESSRKNKLEMWCGLVMETKVPIRMGSMYKILAKLLAARLRSMVGKLVSTIQTAFIPGRNISDGVLVVNEVLDLNKRKKKSLVVLKVDFKKAYDRVSWNFVIYVLKRMGFGDRWMR